MATIPTPEQGKPILDFSAGTFDGSSNLFQSRNGATEHVSGDDVADYVNTSRIYNTLETESKTPVGAINEINAKDASDISYDNTSSGLNATDVNAAIDEINAKDASDIPYSAGVSVADKLDSLKIIKTGKANYTGLKGGGFADKVLVPVAFDSPMPNSAYVAFAMVNNTYNDFPFIRIYPFSKTATGFTAVCINQSGFQTAVSGSFDWVVIS